MTGKQLVQPIFISCDPARDTIEQVRAYMSGGLHLCASSACV